MNGRMNWTDELTGFDRAALRRLGVEAWDLPQDDNPITRALRDGTDLVDLLGDLDGFNKSSVARLASICQMVVYDNQGGPDRDRTPKGLRRHWYSWFKTQFAQNLSDQLAAHGDEKELQGFDGTAWAARLSKTYGTLVDTGRLTYTDLWVSDTSRMMFKMWSTLFSGCWIVFAVEKDSLVQDFKRAAAALGARSLVSGKGKQSKAAAELQLREHFGWSERHDPFTAQKPLIVLHLTDHDMDGEKIIGPTFGDQFRRYTPHVVEARVGIKPEQVDDWVEDWYQVKTTNNGYIDWAEVHGLFQATCVRCGHEWAVQGTGPHECPKCYTETALTVKMGKKVIDQPYGFEVEALGTPHYARLLVDALLEVLPFDYIVQKLRDECRADSWDAANKILQDRIAPENESYTALLALKDAIDEAVHAFENKAVWQIREVGDGSYGRNWIPLTEAYKTAEDDPTVEDFKDHVSSGTDQVWRPFDHRLRTRMHVDALIGLAAEEIQKLQNETVSLHLKGYEVKITKVDDDDF